MRAEVWRNRDAVIGGSDAGAHLDMMCGAIYTTSLLGQLVTLEEAWRWEPPIGTVVRVARRDCELGGIAIPAGTNVTVSVAVANRDPEHYPEPDRFDPTRTNIAPARLLSSYSSLHVPVNGGGDVMDEPRVPLLVRLQVCG